MKKELLIAGSLLIGSFGVREATNVLSSPLPRPVDKATKLAYIADQTQLALDELNPSKNVFTIFNWRFQIGREDPNAVRQYLTSIDQVGDQMLRTDVELTTSQLAIDQGLVPTPVPSYSYPSLFGYGNYYRSIYPTVTAYDTTRSDLSMLQSDVTYEQSLLPTPTPLAKK